MIEINVTAAELAIAELGYDELYPTRQQETLASVYVKMLNSMNGKGVKLDSTDVGIAVAELNASVQSASLPARYQVWLPAIVDVIGQVIALTGDKGEIVRSIGVNAIDRLIDHAIRVLFDNLFGQQAPSEEQIGEIPESIKLVVDKLEELRVLQEQSSATFYEQGSNKIFQFTAGGVSMEE